MQLTKNVITRDEAEKLAPDYVKAHECQDFNLLLKFYEANQTLKRGQKVLVKHDTQYVICKVSSVNWNTPAAIDGPVIRVSNGEFTWRIDGVSNAAPIG